MNIRWIGQSGYILKTRHTEIIIDPYLSDIVNRVAQRPRMVEAPVDPCNIQADAVICTHDHLDHLDPDAILKMPDNQLFITTNEGREKLKKLGKESVKVLNPGESITVGDFTITSVFADHTVEAFGLIVKAEQKTLYFSGDTLYNEKLFSIADYKPNMTFICINGKLGNMDVKEALITAKKIGADINIPNHYGMFESNTEDPEKFTGQISGGVELEFNRVYSCEEIEKAVLHSIK